MPTQNSNTNASSPAGNKVPEADKNKSLIDATEVCRALKLLLVSGQVTEVRALEAVTASDRWLHTVFGYFSGLRALGQALRGIKSAKGIYFIPNPVNPDLFARAANRLRKAAKGESTSDKDIVARRWLLIDCDPQRPSGVSATNTEHEAALERASRISDTLRQKYGWPEPVSADSGNGAHLLYRVDLPIDDAGLLQRCLAALASEFDDEKVTIDKTVFNPARIWKLYGTRACKGDSTHSRPHRMSRVLSAPDELLVVDTSLLEKLAGIAPETPRGHHTTNGRMDGSPFDIESFIAHNCFDIDGPESYQGGRRWIFRQSPMCEHHGDGPYLIQFESGALCAGCHHDSCKEKWGWKELRAKYDLRPRSSTARNSATPPADNGQSKKPSIDCTVRELERLSEKAWEAIGQLNNPPVLFRYGGMPSRIETGDQGELIVKPLNRDMVRYHLARAASWTEWKKRGEDFVEEIIWPPKEVVADVQATPQPPLPILTRLVEAPVFAPDGTLQTSPGFHPASQTYFSPAVGFTVREVPERPEGIDLETARILIVDELLGDFPFVSDAEVAHAVAIILLPFVRDLIDGPTPLHLIEKPSPGTGATLLVDMLSAPFTGRPIPTMTEGRDEDEWRKRITAKLSGGSPFVLIDNLRRRLDSAAVSAGITSTTWEDRILGVSVMARLPVRCVWLATGNNPALSTEITRRTVRIRMDAKLDRPWMRNGFRHKNLRQWANEHRDELVWSALTMIRAWIVAGRPTGTPALGMFERWSEVIGGILDVAGVPGFLSNLGEFYEESDAEGATWRAFLAAWWERFSENETTVKELWQIASDDACLALGDKGEQSQRIMLGKMLADRRDRVFDLEITGKPIRLLLLRGEQRQRAYRWRLRAMPDV